VKTICAWCSVTPVGETVSHGICADCMRTHFPDLADEPAITFPDRVAGNPANASVPDSSGVKAGCFSGPARSLFARSIGLSADGDGIEGIEEGPRRSLFSPRNRFRQGVLGNMMLRSGALRRVA
jgi:hypothetical protein